jgi:NitT/TauT family transport system ATP-binding protein
VIFDPLPNVGLNRVLGLCQLLDDRGGRDDIYRLSRELNYRLGDLLHAIRAAEMLSLVSTPGNDIRLEPLGKRAVEGDVKVKKALLQQQMRELTLFQFFENLLANAPGNELDKAQILEELAILLPNENPKTAFQTLVAWGRFGDLFGYSRDTDRFFLQHRPARPPG